jgi:anti-sigma regulatory factor (Ser/Thr protein kinase)
MWRVMHRMGAAPGLRLRLPAEPESIARARREIAAVGEELGMADTRIGDLKLVVSEATTNVVRHAYQDDDGGEFEIEATSSRSDLKIVIRDFGRGIRPRPRRDDDSLQLGFGLMSVLCSHFDIRGGGAGTTVTLQVPFS